MREAWPPVRIARRALEAPRLFTTDVLSIVMPENHFVGAPWRRACDHELVIAAGGSNTLTRAYRHHPNQKPKNIAINGGTRVL